MIITDDDQVGLIDATGMTIPPVNKNHSAWDTEGNWKYTYRPFYVQSELIRIADYMNPTNDEMLAVVDRVGMGTPSWMTFSFNRIPLPLHQDLWNDGDCVGWCSALMVRRSGELKGFLTAFPELDIAFDLQDGDLLFFDPFLWHGNTEPVGENYQRNVVVMAFDKRPEEA